MIFDGGIVKTLQYQDNPPVILPKVGNMTAPFTQGGLWRAHHFKQCDKLEFTILTDAPERCSGAYFFDRIIA